MSKLKLLVCNNYKTALAQVLKNHQFEGVEPQAFPSACHRIENTKELITSLKESSEATDFALLACKCCPLKKHLSNATKICNKLDLDTMFNLFLPQKAFDTFISQGAYLVTSGWLESWQSNLKEMGFDQPTAAKFFNEFHKKIIYLDLGNSIPNNSLKELSEYINLPYVAVPIDLEYASLKVSSLISEYKTSKIINSQNEELLNYRIRVANYATTLNVLEQIAQTKNKRELIDNLIKMLKNILAPKIIKYHDYNNCKREKPHDKDFIYNFIQSGKSYLQYCKHEFTGVLLRINYNENTIGVLQLENFLFPQYTEQYINMLISISGIIGLSINNAIQYEFLMHNHDRLMHLSIHDPLTGSYNRLYFNQQMDKFAQNEYPENICLIICDIDNLKKVNDTLGHLEGDKLIRRTATILENSFRKSDIVARIGGDEFAVIARNCDKQLIKAIKQRIKDCIDRDNETEATKLSISIGYAITETTTFDFKQIYKEADKKMYLKKVSKKRKFKAKQHPPAPLPKDKMLN